MNITELAKAALSYMTSSNNPAQVTASQTGAYSKEETDDALNQYLDSGSFMTSKFGDNTWPKPNVLGNWRGGQRNELYGFCPIIDEPDGSWTWIENATDGLSTAAYFTFFKEVQTPNGWVRTINPTPVEYRPPILDQWGEGWKVNWIGSSDGNSVLWGQCVNISQGLTKYFVALSNGTADPSQHICAELNPDSNFNNQTRPFVLRDKIIFLTRGNPNLGVYTVQTSDVVAGKIVTPTKVTGWTTEGVGSTIQSDTIMLAAKSHGNLGETDCLSTKDTNGWFSGDAVRLISAAHPTDNKFRVLYSMTSHFSWRSGDKFFESSFIVDVDLDKLTGYVWPQTRYPIKAVNDSADGLNESGEQIPISRRYSTQGGQWHGEAIITGNGRMINLIFHNEGLGTIYVGETGQGPGMTAYDRLHPDNLTYKQSYSQQVFRRFGSAVGGNIYFKGMLPGNNVLVRSTGTNLTDKLNPASFWSCTHVSGSSTGHDYLTDKGLVKGYYPSSDKTPVRTLGRNNTMTLLMTGNNREITTLSSSILDPVAGNTTLYSSMKWDVDSASVIDANGGQVTVVDNTIFDAIRAIELDKVKDRLDPSDSWARCQLWIPPKGKRSYPPMMIIYMYSRNSLAGLVRFYNVDLTFQSGDSTNGVLKSATLKDMVLEHINTSTVGLGTGDNHPAGYVYESCDSNNNLEWTGMLTPCFYYFNVPGGGWGPRLSLYLNPGDDSYSSSQVRYRDSSNWYFGVEPGCVINGVGPCLLDMNTIRACGGAALYYQKADVSNGNRFMQMTRDPNDRSDYVLISSLVSDEFKIYFTDLEDVLINSVYYTIPSQIIDLAVLFKNPGNGKFYVHLQLKDGTVSYVITQDAKANYDLYIGFVATNDTQIIQTEISKTTQFGW